MRIRIRAALKVEGARSERPVAFCVGGQEPPKEFSVFEKKLKCAWGQDPYSMELLYLQ
jgi:hypothetical protein